MSKSKRPSHRNTRDAPQLYQPRVECALFALRDALTGCETIVRYMTEQEGTDWRDIGAMLDAADSDFAKAQSWLHKRHKKGFKNA